MLFIGRLAKLASGISQGLYTAKKSHIYTLSSFFCFLSINTLEKPQNFHRFSSVFPHFLSLLCRHFPRTGKCTGLLQNLLHDLAVKQVLCAQNHLVITIQSISRTGSRRNQIILLCLIDPGDRLKFCNRSIHAVHAPFAL